MDKFWRRLFCLIIFVLIILFLPENDTKGMKKFANQIEHHDGQNSDFGLGSESLTSVPSMPPSFIISDDYGYAYDPAMAYNTQHDEYFAVWGDPYNIYAQRISSRGELIGSEITIAYATNWDFGPSVAYDPVNDRYLVVWARQITTDNWDIYGRFIPWDGVPVSSEFSIDTSTTDSSYSPKIVYASTPQEYLVVWEDYGSGWPEYRVRGRRIFATGGGWPAKFLIAENASDNRRNPDVSYNQWRNEYLVVYDNYYSGTNDENIFGKRFTYNEVVLGGGEFSIAGWPDDEVTPSVVACHLVDQYYVTWTSVQTGGAKLYGRFVEGDGSVEQVDKLSDATSGFPFTQAAPACRWGFQYLLTWEGTEPTPGYGIYGRNAYASYSFDPTFSIIGSTVYSPGYPALVCGSANCLSAWEGYDSTSHAEVYGRIIGNTKPTAAFTISPSGGNAATTFGFDASAVSDIEDSSSELQVRWDWENDGIYDTGWSTTKTATHQYSLACFVDIMFVNVRMQVMDTEGLTDSILHSLSITNTAPNADFSVTPSIGDETTSFQFNATGSSDLECADANLQVRWDWENDGVWDTAWSSTLITNMTFSSATYGWRDTKLEVRDFPGLTDNTVEGYMIDHAPTASFTVTPTSGNTTTNFQFDPSSSTDPDVPTQPYYHLHARWDWEDDGIWDTDWGMCWQLYYHTFTTPGTYTVRLEVRQVEPSLRDSTTRQVVVNPPPNSPPVASFTVTPTSGTTSTNFFFDGSGSSDPEGSSLQARWDWENDGIFDTSWSTSLTANHTFPLADTYIVRLEVKDNVGQTAHTTKTVVVSSGVNQPPTAFFTVTPTTGAVSTIFVFDASGSNDPEGGDLLVRWDWEDDGVYDTVWLDYFSEDHGYDFIGTFTIRLQVEDDVGQRDDTTRQVSVNSIYNCYFLPLIFK